jgi:hypothetical protein
MGNPTEGHSTGPRGGGGTERSDIQLRPIVVFTVGLVVLIAAVYFATVVILRLFTAQADRRDTAAGVSQVQPLPFGEERLPPEPRIQANPEQDLAVLRAREDGVLHTYGWIDREAGLLRVPIDVAMKLVLKEGLPARQPADASPAPGTPALAAPLSPR